MEMAFRAKRIVISVALGDLRVEPCLLRCLVHGYRARSPDHPAHGCLDFALGRGYMSALSGGCSEASGTGSRQGFENAEIGV